MEPTPLITTEVQNINPMEEVQKNNPIENKVPILLKAILIVEWVIYAPVALVILGLSGMATDSPYTPGWQVLLTILLVNSIPALILVTTTIFALRRRSYFFACIPIFIIFFVNIFPLVTYQIAPYAAKKNISFSKVVPKKEELFVCEGQAVLSFNPRADFISVLDVTSNVRFSGWVNAAGGRYIGGAEYNEFIVSDPKYQVMLDECRNPAGVTISELLSVNKALPQDISFDTVVPQQSLYFVCQGEKVLELQKEEVYDVTRFVTKNGWQPAERGRLIGTLNPSKGTIFAPKEGDLSAMTTCKNPEGKTVADVTGKTPKSWANNR